MSAFKTYVRWRPLISSESSSLAIERSVISNETNSSVSLSSQSSSLRPRTWRSGAAFSHVFPTDNSNTNVYDCSVAPTLPQVLEGATCNFFAYGHSGSGKTHTIIGYHYEDDENLGLCLAAARDLFLAINDINAQNSANQLDQTGFEEVLGIAIRLYEVRGKYAYDLFNNGAECHVREGPDGRTHIRGQTEMLEDGRVRVRPIVAMACWSFEELLTTVLAGLELRKTGSSSVHDESSRTHAILELEIVNRKLLRARDAVIERESELVPVGKRATDIYLEEHSKSLIKTPDGQYTINPDVPLNQVRIDDAENEKKAYETRLQAAEEAVVACFSSSHQKCLGGKYIFVDLAGSEYFGTQNTGTATPQTAQERQQGRQINTDLFALKEVIRAISSGQTRIPFRSSPLTMVLRSHFLSVGEGASAMILTVSPSETQFAATVNTLKYGVAGWS